MIQKEHISLASVVEIAGVELSRAGSRRLKGVCPFHADSDPSFVVYPDNHFRCFGCDKHGDVIDFVMDMYQCDFKDALKVLGIDQDEAPEKVQQQIKASKKVRQEKTWHKRAMAELRDEVFTLARTTRSVLSGIKTIEDLEKRGGLFHFLVNLEYHESILLGTDEDLKRELLESDRYITSAFKQLRVRSTTCANPITG